MLGYKIYFDGKKFVMENEKSLVESTPGDSVVSWNSGLGTAIDAVDSLNEHYKTKVEDLDMCKDFLIRKCKDCNSYFILSDPMVNWFRNKDLNLPCRCITCRKKRKEK